MGLQVMGPAGETLSAGLNRNLPKVSQEVKVPSADNVYVCTSVTLRCHNQYTNYSRR